MSKPRLFTINGMSVVILTHDNDFGEFIEFDKINWKEDGEGFGIE